MGRVLGRANRLTAATARTIKKPGQYADGNGLYLQVTDSSTRSWLFRYSHAGRQSSMGLGAYDLMSLADARQTVADLRKKVRQGIDPREERDRARRQAASDRAKKITFSEAVARFLPKKMAELSNAKHKQQWENTLSTYAEPVLGSLWVDEIDVQDVLAVLEPIWAEKNETATRLRSRVESVLDWATVAGFRQGENPAAWKGRLSALLPKPSAVSKVTHQPAISLQDLPRWWRALMHAEGQGALALRLLVLCAARSGEVRGARWSEINLSQKLWIVPAERMKAKREHRVPLSDQAMELIESLPHFVGSDLLFPNTKGTMMSDMTLSAVMRRLHAAQVTQDGIGWVDPGSLKPAVPHGLRSTFRSWAAETGVSHDLAEICLAHEVGNAVARAYKRTDMVERRRDVMDQWARRCSESL